MTDTMLDVFYQDSSSPLRLEIPVNASLKPFLVTSSQALVWTESIREGKVWSVPREPGENIQAETLAAIVSKAYESGWGNLFEFNKEGVYASIARLHANGLFDLDILVSPLSSLESVDEEGVTLKKVSWMPLACAVVVPQLREYVGNLIFFKDRKCSVCVHNARFGMAIMVEV